MSNQADVLRHTRRRKRMTQALLAEAAEVSERTVARAERGDTIGADNLRAICSVLGLDAADLRLPSPPDAREDDAPNSASAGTIPSAGTEVRFWSAGTWVDTRLARAGTVLREGSRVVWRRTIQTRLQGLVVACCVIFATAGVVALTGQPEAGKSAVATRDNATNHEMAQFKVWLAEAVVQSMSMDFSRWRHQQEDASQAFSANGWNEWQQEIRRVGMTDYLAQHKVLNAIPEGAIVLTAEDTNLRRAVFPVLLEIQSMTDRDRKRFMVDVSTQSSIGPGGQPSFRIVGIRLHPQQTVMMLPSPGLTATEASEIFAAVSRQAEEAVLAAHRYHPPLGENQFTELKSYFTADGWKKWQAALAQSGNINALDANNMTMAAKTSGPVLFEEYALRDGTPTWRLRVPMTVDYTGRDSHMSQSLLANIVLQRNALGDKWLLAQIIEAPV